MLDESVIFVVLEGREGGGYTQDAAASSVVREEMGCQSDFEREPERKEARRFRREEHTIQECEGGEASQCGQYRGRDGLLVESIGPRCEGHDELYTTRVSPASKQAIASNLFATRESKIGKMFQSPLFTYLSMAVDGSPASPDVVVPPDPRWIRYASPTESG